MVERVFGRCLGGRWVPRAGGFAGAALALAASGCGGPAGSGGGLEEYGGRIIRAEPPPAETASGGEARDGSGGAGVSMVAPGWEDDWGDEPAKAPETGPDPAAEGSGGPRRVWAIVLDTYSGAQGSSSAARAVANLPRVDPELRNAWVHTTMKGAMVLYGRYESPDDERARRDLEWIKSIEMRNLAVFPRAWLTRVKLGVTADPLALESARRAHPRVDPLYTLQVAAWGDFESGMLSVEEIQDAAEKHTRQLRAQNVEAYYHHDPDKRLSVVTVGLFDRTAIDQRTGIPSAEVEMLIERFKAHLVNGEELREPAPGGGTRIQKPHLVLVPRN